MHKLKWFLLIAVVAVIVYFCFNPIIIDTDETGEYASQYTIDKDNVAILKGLDFTKNNYRALLIIRDKIDLSDEIRGSILETKNNAVLKEIQSEWKFTKTNGDMATVENELLVYEGDKIIFRSGIVLDDSKNSNLQGLQNSDMGWLKSTTDLTRQCKKFERVYFPLVFL